MSPSSETAAPRAPTIRKAGPHDAQAIDRMVSTLAADLSPATGKSASPVDFERALAAAPPLLNGLIAEKDTAAVGLCLWFPWFSTWRGAAGLYVQDLYVAPSARRLGLARRLLAAAVEETRPFKGAFLRLSVDAANAPALAFYRRLGFARVEGEHLLDLSGAPFQRLIEAKDSSQNITEPE